MKYCVSYATDENYVQHVAVSLVSLFENNQKDLFDVYILVNNVTESHLKNLKLIGTAYKQNIFFISISHLIENLSKLNFSVNKLTITTYARLFLSKLLPEYVDRILYLDCDTVIVGDITGIWKHDITDLYVAGVIDTMFPYYKESIFLPQDKYYINAGVLFINIKKWRNEDVDLRFLEFINSFKGSVPHLDQGVINGVFHDKEILELKYNVQTPVFLIKRYSNLLRYFSLTNYYSEKDFLESKNGPVIIHYSSFFANRPWFSFCLHPMKSIYINYLEKTPYRSNKLVRNPRLTLSWKVKALFFVYVQSIYFKVK